MVAPRNHNALAVLIAGYIQCEEEQLNPAPPESGVRLRMERPPEEPAATGNESEAIKDPANEDPANEDPANEDLSEGEHASQDSGVCFAIYRP